MNKLIRYAQIQNIGKPNNLKVFGRKKTKGHKRDLKNSLMSLIPEGGEP